MDNRDPRLRRRLLAVAAIIAITAIAAVAAAAARAAPLAEMVLYKAEDGRRLTALLWSPEGPTTTVMIMIPGGTGGYSGGAHDYNPLAAKLVAEGYAFMLADMRTAGSNGWLHGDFADTEKDVGAAVSYAKSRGLDDILLFGTSLGGPRIAYYWAMTKEPAIRAMGFLAAITSPYGEAQMRFEAPQRAEFDAFLGNARSLVAAGKSRELISYQWFPSRNFTLSAASWISYFGTDGESDASSVKWGGEITVPAVIIHGEDDEIAFRANPEGIRASLTRAPRRDMIIVEGTGHYMQSGPIAERYAGVIVDWVMEFAPPRRGE